MPEPGALTSGLIEPSHGDGPRLLKEAMASVLSVAPTAKESGSPPGVSEVFGFGPLLPAAKAGKIPAARQAWTSGRNSVIHPKVVKAQELLTTSGALAALPPGARNHWKIWWKASVVLVPASFQALAAIHTAP